MTNFGGSDNPNNLNNNNIANTNKHNKNNKFNVNGYNINIDYIMLLIMILVRLQIFIKANNKDKWKTSGTNLNKHSLTTTNGRKLSNY